MFLKLPLVFWPFGRQGWEDRGRWDPILGPSILRLNIDDAVCAGGAHQNLPGVFPERFRSAAVHRCGGQRPGLLRSVCHHPV